MNRAMRRAMEKAKPVTLRSFDKIAGLRLLNKARPYEGNEMVDEHIKTRMAYQRLRDGDGNEEDFDRVSMMLNIGLIRAEKINGGQLLVDTMQHAQKAMLRTKDRFERGLRFGFDADGLVSVPAALDAYEVVMDASSPLQMEQAIKEAYRRISNGDTLEVA